MHLAQSAIMGVIQGLSEFLPISSSGHLVITSNLYKVFNKMSIVEESNQEIFLDIMLHFGTLIAVIIFFRKDIYKIIKAVFNGVKNRDYSSIDCKIGLYIILGTTITTIIALFLNNIAADLVFKPAIVGILLFITGIILLFSENFSKNIKEKKEISLKNSIYIALAQGLAALPGFSRSGLTIATGLFLGNDRTTAARYSFLLSIPIIIGASMVYPFVKIDLNEAISFNWTAIVLGTIISTVVGYICIKYFMKFLSKFSLAIFGYYCIFMGIFTFFFFIGR